MLRTYSYSWLLWQKMGNYVHRVRLTVTMCPPPSHHRMDSLLDATSRLRLFQPNGPEHIRNISGLNLSQ